MATNSKAVTNEIQLVSLDLIGMDTIAMGEAVASAMVRESPADALDAFARVYNGSPNNDEDRRLSQGFMSGVKAAVARALQAN